MDLQELRKVLVAGQRLGMQGSYQRRAPAKKAISMLVDARAELRKYVQENDQDQGGWRLLAQAEECLLSCRAARACLERAMSLAGSRDKKDLKKLALLREYESKWRELTLAPEQLAALGRHLESRLAVSPCDHTFRETTAWLDKHASGSAKKVSAALRDRGGFCDCEVLTNVVRG